MHSKLIQIKTLHEHWRWLQTFSNKTAERRLLSTYCAKLATDH